MHKINILINQILLNTTFCFIQITHVPRLLTNCHTFLEGFNNQSNYNLQGGGGGSGNQGFGANHSQYHNPVGYGRGESSMNYQYR